MYAILLGFITAFALTYAIIPLIITFAKDRQLYDQPNARSSHKVPTPSLGGIGIFAGGFSGIILWTPTGSFGLLQYILAAFVLIFLIGILDDLLLITPIKKLGGQILVAILLSYKAGVTITSFYGFWGIHELSSAQSFLLSIIAIVGIINAFNLIDGINGLAGSVGLLSCLVFGVCLFLADALALSIVAFSLAGAILAFLKYNFTPAKIFMGDTGSLFLGTVCAILAITFIETNYKLPPHHPFQWGAAPAIAVAVLILPLYDTLSVFMRRIVRGRSPFAPDKTHIHHQLLSFGLNHTQTTAVLLAVNLLFVGIALGLNQRGFIAVLWIESVLAFCFTLLLIALPRIHERKRK